MGLNIPCPATGYFLKSSSSLQNCKQASVLSFKRVFVIRLGFEPKTHSLEGCCSIQLSYRTILSWTSVLLSGLIHSELFSMAQPHKTSCTDIAHAICGCKGSAFSRPHQIFLQLFFSSPQNSRHSSLLCLNNQRLSQNKRHLLENTPPLLEYTRSSAKLAKRQIRNKKNASLIYNYNNI